MKKPIKQAIEEQQQRAFRAEDKLKQLKNDYENGRETVELSNEDVFLDMIETEDSVIVAMARTMLFTKAQEIVKHKAEIIESHKKSFVSGEFVVHAAEQLVKRFSHKE